VPPRPKAEALSEKRYATFMLRILVDRRGRLVHGEVTDVEFQTEGRFKGWRQLPRTIRALLARQQRDDVSGGASSDSGDLAPGSH
jgi:hypothetical protein